MWLSPEYQPLARWSVQRSRVTVCVVVRPESTSIDPGDPVLGAPGHLDLVTAPGQVELGPAIGVEMEVAARSR